MNSEQQENDVGITPSLLDYMYMYVYVYIEKREGKIQHNSFSPLVSTKYRKAVIFRLYSVTAFMHYVTVKIVKVVVYRDGMWKHWLDGSILFIVITWKNERISKRHIRVWWKRQSWLKHGHLLLPSLLISVPTSVSSRKVRLNWL